MESDIKTLLKARDMKKPIFISLSVSDNYSQHLAVVLTSFLINNPDSQFVFHVLHRNISDKNQSLLVDAFADVADEFPDWQVHIYGRGKEKDESALLKRISAKRLKNRIFMKGYADLSEPYAKCAFAAFPSKTEGFPLTLVDAAMFAKPTLMIHDWIGCGEVVKTKKFVAALRKLMADSEYRKLIGVQSKGYCEKNYSRSYILDKWETNIKVVKND